MECLTSVAKPKSGVRKFVQKKRKMLLNTFRRTCRNEFCRCSLEHGLKVFEEKIFAQMR